ncbi:MAG: hypothetical protein HF981_12550 [Desulfobacteraceae bacterium]|nr:hypothetical protein [Desulfobacteraceae bacterium]MBC2751210.1 hypothetical protein [Desulfobacteraceae bacterium]
MAEALGIPGARSANTLRIHALRNTAGQEASDSECHRIYEQEHLVINGGGIAYVALRETGQFGRMVGNKR